MIARVNGVRPRFDDWPGRIFVEGRAGDDSVIVEESMTRIQVPVFVCGGSGNDEIAARGGPNVNARGGTYVEVGGPGDDLLHAAHGAEVLFGGTGADELHAGGGDDLLDSGPTAYDTPIPTSDRTPTEVATTLGKPTS